MEPIKNIQKEIQKPLSDKLQNQSPMILATFSITIFSEGNTLILKYEI